MNAYIDHEWILNIIGSCNNDFHFSCVDKMIQLFKDKYRHDESTYELFMELEIVRHNKWNSLHSILI